MRKCSGNNCPMHYGYDVEHCTLTKTCGYYTAALLPRQQFTLLLGYICASAITCDDCLLYNRETKKCVVLRDEVYKAILKTDENEEHNND